MIYFNHTKELYLFYHEIVIEALYKRIFERKIFFLFKLSMLWFASILIVIILSFIWPLIVGSFLVSAVVDVMIWAKIKLKVIRNIKIFFRFFIGIGLIIWLIIAGPNLTKYTKKIFDGSSNTRSATRIESKTGTPLIDPEKMASEDQKWYAETELNAAVRDGTLSKIVRVVDGDTIVVNIADKNETIRLIGINAPEMSQSQEVSAECFAQESSNYFKKSLLGKYIRLETDPSQEERDKFNRLLRYVILKDGSNFNKTLVREGMAKEYTYKTAYKYQKEFKLAEQEARKAKIGLWDLCYNDNNNDGDKNRNGNDS